MIGPPFSGKGTQCKLISNKLGIKHVSTGEIIRKEIENKTEYGMKVATFEKEGSLVPDFLIKELLKKIIETNLTEDAIIIDGFPRSMDQVDFFLPFLQGMSLKIDLMIILNISDIELMLRGKKRIGESKRIDDTSSIQKVRLNFYEKSTIPAIEYLKTKVEYFEVLAEGTIDGVNETIIKKILQ